MSYSADFSTASTPSSEFPFEKSTPHELQMMCAFTLLNSKPPTNCLEFLCKTVAFFALFDWKSEPLILGDSKQWLVWIHVITCEAGQYQTRRGPCKRGFVDS